jgi:membrane protease YdiL (CAAX protease family)
MRNRIVASEGASVYMFGLCGASLLGNFFMRILAGRVGLFYGMSIVDWVAYAIMQVAFVAVVFLMGAWRKYDPVKVARLRPSTNWKQYLLLPFIAIFAIMTFLPLADWFSQLLFLIGYKGAGATMPVFENVGVYFLALFIMAMLPAFGEELLCRGILQTGLNTRGVGFGIFMSAFFFSFMHANPLQTIHQFGLGVILAVVYILSGSLLPCILLHFLNNFITLTITAYIPEIEMAIVSLGNWNYLTGTASMIVGLFGLAILLYIYYRVGENRKAPINKVFENDVVFENYTITVSMNGAEKKSNAFLDTMRFVGSLFTKKGWRKVSRTLSDKMDVPALGKQQPMITVWIALGFAIFYWVLNFIFGFI